MIKSMTAYAEKTKDVDGLQVTAEIRTYNSRYLDFVPRLPGPYRYLENSIKQAMSERISRGRVEVFLFIKDGRPQATTLFAVDEARALAYRDALQTLRAALGIEDPLRLSLFTRPDEFIKTADPEKPGEEEGALVLAVVNDCLDDLDIMRQQEGQHLAEDMASRIDIIEATVKIIAEKAAGLTDYYRTRITERLAELLDRPGTTGAGLDESRLAQEVAILADKSDISEEIVRAESHINQFRETLKSDEPCGRKLNFLLQEFNREFNTIGSKSGLVDISEKVVAAKTELEKLREQVQNIE